MAHTSLIFRHGLGDFANFLQTLPVYLRLGHTFDIYCAPDRHVLGDALGGGSPDGRSREFAGHVRLCPIDDAPAGTVEHHWPDPHNFDDHAHVGGTFGTAWFIDNKTFNSLGAPPMPGLDALSRETSAWDVVNYRLRWAARSPQSAVASTAVRQAMDRFPRPHILVHTHGGSAADLKSFPAQQANALIQHLTDVNPGTILRLDGPGIYPPLSPRRSRVHSLQESLAQRPSPAMLLAAIDYADVLVGVDSAMIHLARYTETPTIGLWLKGRHPAAFALPSRHAMHLVAPEGNGTRNRSGRAKYRVVPLNVLDDPRGVAQIVAGVLEHRSVQDVFMSELYRLGMVDFGGERHDRHHAWTTIHRLLRRRREGYRIVETGCVRCWEDWGAGYSTYLWGCAVQDAPGSLVQSFDIDGGSCACAREVTAEFPWVRVNQRDSLEGLKGVRPPVDLVYLDSWDRDLPGHDGHNLQEFLAVEPILDAETVVAIDDTTQNVDGSWSGKGAKTVPYMLSRGWSVKHAGTTVVLAK